jgi:hypothetical protein
MLPPDDCVEFLKGIKNKETMYRGVFDHGLFSEDFGPVPELPGMNGTSINWDLQDGGALEQILKQVARGNISPKFKEGAMRIPREVLDELIKKYGSENFGYELREENGNIYHGHILVSPSLQSRHRVTICAVIVTAFTELHLREQSI